MDYVTLCSCCVAVSLLGEPGVNPAWKPSGNGFRVFKLASAEGRSVVGQCVWCHSGHVWKVLLDFA